MQHQRREGDTNYIVYEEGRQHSRERHGDGEKAARALDAGERPAGQACEEAGLPEVRDDDHHAKQERERGEVDRRNGVPDLTHPAWLYGEGRVAQIEHTILYGIRSGNPRGWSLADMPAYAQAEPYKRYKVPSLEPGEIRDVVEFLMVTSGKPGDRAAAERGTKIFADKGQCFDCHSTDAQGDAAIGAPNLIDDIWLYGSGSREDIYESIARGRAGICPAWAKELSPVTVRALAVLVYATSHQEAPKTAVGSSGPATGSGG